MRNSRDQRRLWKWTNLSLGALAGEPVGGSFTGPLGDRWRRALEMEHLSLI
jgi:hypothetical protein